MPLETAAYIDDLNASYPEATDQLAQADDHIRLIKAALLATFAGFTGATTVTNTTLNTLQSLIGTYGSGLLPVGTVISTLKSTTPQGGFLPLAGGTYAYNDYPNLGAYLGASPGGNFTLPDMYTAGRFLRSYTASTAVGTLQDSQNKTHTHTASTTATGTADASGSAHAHSGVTGGQSNTHTHPFSTFADVGSSSGSLNPGVTAFQLSADFGTSSTAVNNTDHSHTFTTNTDGAHSHNLTISASTTVNSDGGSEARPVNLSVAMWVKY